MLVAALLPPSASPTPTHVILSLTGTAKADNTGNNGTFTAPPPICPSGTWQGNAAGHRTFTCTDGTGTFGASFDGRLEFTGGKNIPWHIDSGTGKYATLRGVGTGIAVVTVPGTNPQFKDTWDGNIDFDASAPTLASVNARVKHIRPGHRHYAVRLRFTAADNIATNPVGYKVTLFSGNTQLADKHGIATAPVTLTLRVRGPRTGHFRLFFDLHDPVGNERTSVRRIPIPRR